MWEQLLSFLGKEGIGNLMKTGVDLYSAFQAGDKMDFDMEMDKDNQRKNNILFDQQQKDRTALQNIDFQEQYMFSASNKKPDSYETRTSASGPLALLMKALGNIGTGAQNISKSAGTAVAGDRLDAMTPEQRADPRILDKMQGLALTEQFRKRLEGQEGDAVSQQAVKDKNEFITGRDKTLHGYNMARDRAKTKSGTGAGASGPTAPVDGPAMASLRKIIADDTAAAAGNDVQDGRGLNEKLNNAQLAQQAIYDMLIKSGMNEVTARKQAFELPAGMKENNKRIAKNVYKETD